MSTNQPTDPTRAPPSPNPEVEEEPVTTGTVFLTLLVLVVIGGIWIIVYRLLLER